MEMIDKATNFLIVKNCFRVFQKQIISDKLCQS